MNCVPFIEDEFIEIKIPFQQSIIKQMESKICLMCKIEKDINNFYKKYTE